jgi:hypothetical protein
MRKVLVLTYKDDPHAKSVCGALSGLGAESFVVATEGLARDCRVNFRSDTLLYEISVGERTAVLDSSWNIWNRRLMIIDRDKGLPKALEDLVFDECEKTWDGLLSSHEGKVVNRPYNHFHANNKLDQIRFSRMYGEEVFVPDTLVTNDPEALRDFYKRHGGKICFKLQKGAVVKSPEGENLIVYTNLVTDEHMDRADLVSTNPSLFQEYVDKEFEVRIVSTDHGSFGTAIYSQDSDISRVDYRRYDMEKVRYKPVDLPEHVGKFCSSMLRHYGLHFGVFDFIYSKDHRWVFLELNPNGQWLWLEEQSGQNLSQEVAKNLL